MPKLVWLCDVCRKVHPTCDLAAKCERGHPPGAKPCEACGGTGDWLYNLDKCDDCNGAGVVVETGKGTGERT